MYINKGGSLSIIKLWYSSDVKLFTKKIRFIIYIFYTIGAFLAPILVRIFLKPFVYSYRQHYDVPNKEFIQNFQITNQILTSSATTRTTPFKPINPRVLFKSTPKITTPARLIAPNILVIDFLRLDQNEEGGDSLYRLFEKNFNLVFYIITGLNSLIVIFFSIFFLIETKIFRYKPENGQSIEMSAVKCTTTKMVKAQSSLPNTTKLSNMSILISNNTIETTNKPKRSKYLNIIISITLLFLITILYSLIFASFKIQSIYLLSYSIQPEYVQRYYDEYFNELFTYSTTPLISSVTLNDLVSFNTSYNFLSFSLVDGSYLLIVYYLGCVLGIALNLILITFTPLSSISLLYFNTFFHTVTQIFSLLLVSTSTEYSISKPIINLIWFFLQFSNGFFLSSIPALFYDHFSLNQSDKSSPSRYYLKSNYLTACELFGLSIGAAVLQSLIPYLIELNNNFNSFINISLLYSSVIISFLLTIHISILVINKKKNSVSPVNIN